MTNIIALIKNNYEHYVLRHPRIVLLVLTALLLAFATQVPKFRLDSSADSLLLEDDKDLQLFREITARYNIQDFMFIAFIPEAGLFTRDTLDAISEIRNAIKKLPTVDSVISITDVPLVQQKEGSISRLKENMRTIMDADVDMQKVRMELLNSPVFKELIISPDSSATGMQINLKSNARLDALLQQREKLRQSRRQQQLDTSGKQKLQRVEEEYNQLRQEVDRLRSEDIVRIREIIAPWKSVGTLYLGGMPMIVDDMIRFIRSDLVVFGSGMFLFFIIMLSILFKHPGWTIIPLLSCIYSVVMIIGLLGLLDWTVTVISSNFISLMLIITMSINIHLIVRYRQLYASFPNMKQQELVARTTQIMVWPCLFTVLTTIIAFCSLMFSGIKPVTYFGWMMTLGLGISFISSFLLFPSLLLLMSPPGSEKTTDDNSKNGKGWFTQKLAYISDHHGGAVLFVSGLFAAISIFGITRLAVENSFINYFKQDTEIHQGLKLIDDKLGGTGTIDVILDLSSTGTEDQTGEILTTEEDVDDLDALFSAFEEEQKSEKAWLTPARLDKIKAVHDYLDSIPALGKVLSLASVLRVGEQIQGAEFDALELAVLSKNIPDVLRTAMFDPFLSEQDNEVRIRARVLDSLPELRRQQLLDDIHQGLEEKLAIPVEKFRISGLMVLYNNMLQSLFQSQIQTLGVVMLGIALMLWILFRSIRLACIGIIPNLLAAAIILGVMGLLRIPLDMMTITIAAITIGIATDNSIHYIYRFREELPRFGDYTKTMYHCHTNIGKAIFYTAITIITGFAILALSNFIPTIYFGLFTALAMIIALLAALTLLPRLILLLKPF